MRVGGFQQADYGWLAVFGVVVVAEVAGAKRHQMLSHAVIRYKRAHPVLTTAVVMTTAFHLLEWIDPDVDPFHRTYEVVELLHRAVTAPQNPRRRADEQDHDDGYLRFSPHAVVYHLGATITRAIGSRAAGAW